MTSTCTEKENRRIKSRNEGKRCFENRKNVTEGRRNDELEGTEGEDCEREDDPKEKGEWGRWGSAKRKREVMGR